MPAALDAYVESKVMTATAYELHLMVLEGALRHATLAEQALERKNYDKAHLAIRRATELVTEMLTGLNPAKSPEVVASLKSLFLFVHRKLVEADLKRDPKRAADAVKILRMHRDTWVALDRKLKQESAPAVAIAEIPAGGFSFSA
jgi:flagellar secretion chaperone FliS